MNDNYRRFNNGLSRDSLDKRMQISDITSVNSENLKHCDLRFKTLLAKGIPLDSPRTSTSQLVQILQTINTMAPDLDSETTSFLLDALNSSHTNLKRTYDRINWDALTPKGKVYDFVRLYQQGIDRMGYHIQNIDLILDGPMKLPIKKNQFKAAENYARLLHNMDFGQYMRELK